MRFKFSMFNSNPLVGSWDKKTNFHKLGVRFLTILADSNSWKMLLIKKVNVAYQIL
jgi:hypothetical protein